MILYKVTTELKTSWWMKILRFLRVKKERTEFEICLNYGGYNIGDMLHSGISGKLKILEKEHQDGTFIGNLEYC
jgi:hypothetical protein